MLQESQIGRPIEVDTTTAANRFLSGVFLWMFVGLAITTLSAFLVTGNPLILHTIVSKQWLFYALLIAEIAIVVAISVGGNLVSAGLATLLFLVYSVLNGMTLSILFLVFTNASILRAFIGATCLFAAMAVYGYATKRDLSRFGSLLFVGLIAVIASSVINMFLGSQGFDYVISIAGIGIFLGLTAYDTQKILRIGESLDAYDSQTRQKAMINGALALYLDFINLFIYLLRVFGRRR
jgi:Integral membrane protein, interacts with FtsH